MMLRRQGIGDLPLFCFDLGFARGSGFPGTLHSNIFAQTHFFFD
jgi:hypothetical protein